MSILGFFKKHEKIETYEKRTAPMAKIIPFPEKEKKERTGRIEVY